MFDVMLKVAFSRLTCYDTSYTINFYDSHCYLAPIVLVLRVTQTLEMTAKQNGISPILKYSGNLRLDALLVRSFEIGNQALIAWDISFK